MNLGKGEGVRDGRRDLELGGWGLRCHLSISGEQRPVDSYTQSRTCNSGGGDDDDNDDDDDDDDDDDGYDDDNAGKSNNNNNNDIKNNENNSNNNNINNTTNNANAYQFDSTRLCLFP